MPPPHRAHRNPTSKRSSLVSSPMCPMLVLLAPFRFFQTSETKVLTNPRLSAIIIFAVMGWRCYAGVAQLVEQLICNQQVGGSNPSTSSRLKRGLFKRQPLHMGEFQSGQMGQTVNLLFRLRWFESTLSHQDFEGDRFYLSPFDIL